jgi:ABC-type multidrug transport system fused ATPase/permease subunit
VVLVADKMPFLRRFDYAPLAYPILFKTIVYTALVGGARLIEALIHFLLAGGVLGGGRFVEHVLGEFSWSRFIATQMWIFVLFLVWVTANEVNNLIGDGELFRISFTRRSSALKSTRRARIRLLTRLSRLTDAHPVTVLEDHQSVPHRELVAILRSLAHPP